MARVGIIGCGDISRFHQEGYRRAGAQVVHVCDINRETATSIAAKFDARASTDYRALLDDPEVELVSITTMTAYHKALCLDAIAAGKGVICEKTLTGNANDSYEVANAAEQAGVFFTTAYMKRFFPAVQKAKTLLSTMGDIISVYARSWQPWDLWNTPLTDDLFAHPSSVYRKSAGGVLACGGSHILDLLHWLVGRPKQVCGQLHYRDNADFDIQANAMLWFEQGGLAHFEACWHPLRFAGYEKNGWDERIEINTTHGRLDLYIVLWNQPEKNGAMLVHQDAVTGQTTEYRYHALNPFYEEIAEAVRRFDAGEPGSPSVWDGYVVDEMIEHITSSASKNTILPVVWKDRVAHSF
ncbi:MAG TPA: Gfo/Idh/MocA family oxidoreductase [Armatimonadota bacterium]|nr:Gfo/Idh/MocA family oxidoreductase [Armatimonadota bacterium]